VTKKHCPLGEDCDLTLAWMMGAEDARDRERVRIAVLTEQLEAARRDAKEAEAYAEELEAKLAGAVAECERIGRLWYDAESKLAKAVEALRSIAANTCCTPCQEAALVARATLAEIEGDKP
jgi:DNA repair exonuclease SbcCD ATPase subunit